ncbi:MAG: serine/threonine-protein kinase [Planctomycetota bacterium]|jgi:serine/threonine-protein kinase
MEPQKEQKGLIDDAEFEASLISDIDSEMINAETQLIDSSTIQPLKTPPDLQKHQPAWVGKRLGNFKLLRLIGEGKMGRVIQAEDINLRRIVALKILNKRIPGVDEQQRVLQFLREARAAVTLEHPNVVRIYAIDQHDGWWYIAMEMLEGENLRTIVKATGPLPQPRACMLIADAANALAAAHKLGIIHRDIKPTNLMLTRSGRCKLTDFGLVKLDDPNDPFDFTDKAVGSPQFMAPEMINRQKQTPAIDIYSLGATLYYALAAKPPYPGTKIEEILKKHLNDPVPDLSKESQDYSPSLVELVKRMMAKEPQDRPSAADVTAMLRAEAISWKTEDSALLSSAGTAMLFPHDSKIGTPTIMIPRQTTPILKRFLSRISSHKFLISGAVVAILILVIAAFSTAKLWLPRKIRFQDYAEFFPDSPETYGVLPPEAIWPPINPTTISPPPFSWKGKIDTEDIKFVASKSGRYFYPINSSKAVLIPENDFIGYESEEDALTDGKSPAQ